MDTQPGYIKMFEHGELKNRVARAYKHLAICNVCALECPVNRHLGQVGACKTGMLVKVSSYGPHMGEENPLRGYRGSGTIFFSGCNLRCQYCQNHDISQTDSGFEVQSEELAAIMLDLQERGCHNINFVSPSHIVPQILAGVLVAAEAGLKIPLVYNTGGYDSLKMLQLLDGIIDIYLPDMKYANSKIGHRYSKIPNYPRVNQTVVKEMHRQVGDLQINDQGIATRGLLVRHLILPNNLAGTDQIVQFLANEISPNTYLNLMTQYRPEYRAHQFQDLNQRIGSVDYQRAFNWAQEVGMSRLDQLGN